MFQSFCCMDKLWTLWEIRQNPQCRLGLPHVRCYNSSFPPENIGRIDWGYKKSCKYWQTSLFQLGSCGDNLGILFVNIFSRAVHESVDTNWICYILRIEIQSMIVTEFSYENRFLVCESLYILNLYIDTDRFKA